MKLLCRLVMLCFVGSLLVLSGCGGGGGDDKSVPGLVTSVGWVYNDLPADYSNNAIALNVWVYYDQAIAASEIEGFTATPPDGVGRWTVTANSNNTGTTSSGHPYLTAKLVNSNTPGQLPLAGTWTFTLRLKNGTTSSYRKQFHEPGSSAYATHPYVYVREEWTPYTNPSQYVPALGRFSTFGYTVQYSSVGGGSITSTGLANVRNEFFNAEPLAYNSSCWLYDTNNVYLGYTNFEYTTTDHSSTGLFASNGELAITPAATTATTATTGLIGPVDLSLVKYIRFVYYDGAQFAPAFGYDFRSVSYLVPVN
ncbi:hypothetical protein [Geomonas propionica]|uniref:Lipoprotein n=1 Tax=Geomonas propionica TaxID=2798582 RepID=A0ABS0YM59_9BACT|nr:hypothetical protein [Geomonas propionica]MBJ6799032.1 hypothetical protein [Geomonas propionica]